MLAPQFPALSQTFVLNEIAGLLERGHDVTVFALEPAPDANAAVHPVVREHDLLARSVYLSPEAGWRSQAAEWARALAELPGAGAARFLGGLARLRPADLRRAIRIAARGPFDVVHAQFGPLGLFAAGLREAGLLEGALLTSFRGWDLGRYPRQYGAAVYAPLFRSGDLFLPNCEHFARRLLELGCPSERIAVKRSGIDLERFHFRPRHAPGAGEPLRIAAVGRLVEKKGFGDALDALASLARSRSDWLFQLELVGDGPLREPLALRAAELGIAEQVRFCGWQNHEALAATLDAAHLLIAPSRTAEDGDQDAPVNTLKEAMATGLPVVATRHGGIPELVEDGVSGWLAAEADPGDLARALGRLLEAPERWEALGRAGRVRVEADYDRRRTNAHLETLYRRALTEPPAPGAGAGLSPPCAAG